MQKYRNTEYIKLGTCMLSLSFCLYVTEILAHLSNYCQEKWCENIMLLTQKQTS